MSFRKTKDTVSNSKGPLQRSGREGDLFFFQILVECGRLSLAATRLDRSVSSVSKQLTSLEQRLAIQLIRRDAHSFSLTEAGQHYFEEAVALNARLNALELDIKAMSHTVSGPLRVSSSEGIFDSLLKRPLQQFMRRHPEIHLSMSITGHGSRLGDDAYDCQILRIDPDDIPAHMQTLNLGRSSGIVCASALYLERHGCPEDPRDLKAFDCLTNINKSGKLINHWHFKHGRTRVSVSIEPRFSGPGWQVREMATSGLGIARLPEHLVRCGESENELVEVLSDWEDTERRVVTLMYPGNQRPTPQLERFVAFLSGDGV